MKPILHSDSERSTPYQEYPAPSSMSRAEVITCALIVKNGSRVRTRGITLPKLRSGYVGDGSDNASDSRARPCTGSNRDPRSGLHLRAGSDLRTRGHRNLLDLWYEDPRDLPRRWKMEVASVLPRSCNIRICLGVYKH
ncbi:hypothetical protein U1Q18_020843 [Sarracenia purpurea var. burkii]